MDLQLTGKKALVTGASAGIGFSIAKMLAAEGADVVLCSRSAKNLQTACDKITDLQPDAKMQAIAVDFADTASIDSLIEACPSLDILINNVGIYASKSFQETSDREWENMFQVNVMSGVRLARHYLPIMVNAGWGRVIFVSSECAQLVPADLIAYSATKAALLALSRGLAQIASRSGVTVNSVLPGSTLTEGAENFLEQQARSQQKSVQEITHEFFSSERATSLLGRFATPEEIAQTVVYLSSPLAVATNGASIKLDGGSIPGIL